MERISLKGDVFHHDLGRENSYPTPVSVLPASWTLMKTSVKVRTHCNVCPAVFRASHPVSVQCLLCLGITLLNKLPLNLFWPDSFPQDKNRDWCVFNISHQWQPESLYCAGLDQWLSAAESTEKEPFCLLRATYCQFMDTGCSIYFYCLDESKIHAKVEHDYIQNDKIHAGLKKMGLAK